MYAGNNRRRGINRVRKVTLVTATPGPVRLRRTGPGVAVEKSMDMSKIKRILIVRTDRIGDVVLSTPAITAARKAFPDAYIACLVSEATRDIVQGNPCINEVIVFSRKHTLRLSGYLRAKRFDLALILHSTARINILCFLAGIPRRMGYARHKMDFFLTDRLAYTKGMGRKHESEYSLDVLRCMGIKAESSPLVMPLSITDENVAKRLLLENGIKEGERFLMIHPGASHVSKVWGLEKFAKVSDILSERFSLKIVLVSSAAQAGIGERVRDLMKYRPVFLCGKTPLKVLAALLKRSSLFISNDSGPVHIACAVGAGVISIFSRNEKGLSPARWGPLGKRTAVLHKDVGCVECLAHNCKKGFLCLNSITVEEVVKKAEELL